MGLAEGWEQRSIAEALAHRAASDPNGPFLIDDRKVLTFGQVESQAGALAASLHHLGIEAGDRVALVLPSCPEFVVGMFAVAKLGAVIVPLNPHFAAHELQYMLRHSEAVAAITAEDLDDLDFLQLFEELMTQLPSLQYLITVGEEDLWYDDRIFQFEDLISAGAGRSYPTDQPDAENELFAILYTSGTTGKPKGVGLSDRNLLVPAARTAEGLGLTEGDRVVGLLALSHVFGLGPGILGSLLSGAALILSETLEGDTTLDLIERHGATVHYGVPTIFVRELEAQAASPRDLSTLRCGLVAGAPVSDELVRAVEAHLLPELLIAYSLTETSSTVCMTGPSDPMEKRHFTLGRPIEGTDVKVVGPEGEDLPEESVGEIAVRGPGVMSGYYRQPKETASFFDDDQFLLTGDLGMVDEDGYVHLVGRRKEVIIRGSINVYPREVEDRLHSHPAVDVAAVVGIPDDDLGEAICACIVPVEGAIVTDQEIRDWCAVTLADHRIPDVVRFLDAFPETGTGKIRRIELSRMMREEGQSHRI